MSAFDPAWSSGPDGTPWASTTALVSLGAPELRRLHVICKGLRDPGCDGPDPVYAVATGVGRQEHHGEPRRRFLLLGIVVCPAGRLGEEPVRSQGHVHGVAPHSGWSPPELYEIWNGRGSRAIDVRVVVGENLHRRCDSRE